DRTRTGLGVQDPDDQVLAQPVRLDQSLYLLDELWVRGGRPDRALTERLLDVDDDERTLHATDPAPAAGRLASDRRAVLHQDPAALLGGQNAGWPPIRQATRPSNAGWPPIRQATRPSNAGWPPIRQATRRNAGRLESPALQRLDVVAEGPALRAV